MNFSASIVVGLCLILSMVNFGIVVARNNPVLMISMDGMRSDKFDTFVAQNPSCNFSRIINNGLKAEYMIPVFPSQTFPNHWSIATGVYTEVHGIVGNVIYDPTEDKIVELQSGSNPQDPRWWNRSDPIWLTARNQGLKTAVSFWPGSEVWSRNPDIFLRFNKDYTFKSRIDEMVNWIVKFDLDLGLLYFNEPDSTGHTFGPDSQQYMDMIKEMDDHIGYLLDSLDEVDKLNQMNIILLSDHGMSKSLTKSIYVPNYVDSSLIDYNRTVLAYASNIYPRDMSRLGELFDALHNVPNTTVYYKKDVPANFHYSNSDRIGPIVAIADEGYVHTNNADFAATIGVHGFDNSLYTMRAIFTASGPNFKKNQQIAPFENVNVQPLICKLLGLESSQSNGSASIFEANLQSVDVSVVNVKSNAAIQVQNFSKSIAFFISLISFFSVKFY